MILTKNLNAKNKLARIAKNWRVENSRSAGGRFANPRVIARFNLGSEGQIRSELPWKNWSMLIVCWQMGHQNQWQWQKKQNYARSLRKIDRETRIDHKDGRRNGCWQPDYGDYGELEARLALSFFSELDPGDGRLGC